MDTINNLSLHIRTLWIKARQLFELRTTGSYTGWGGSYMPRWDGGVDSKGVHHKSTWEQIALFCEANYIQPEVLINALFYRESMIPQPNQAHGAYALKKYKLYNEPTIRQEARMGILNEFEAQKSYTASNIRRLCQYGNKTEEEALRLVALDSSSPLSQLFRYCVLKNQNRPIAEEYLEVARRQYYQQKELYDEIWSDWLPAELKMETSNEGYSSQAQVDGTTD